MSQPKNTGHGSNVGGSDYSGSPNKEGQTKKSYPLNASHRFEAGEEGPATDYELQQKAASEWQRQQRERQHQQEILKSVQEARDQFNSRNREAFKVSTNQNETTPEGAIVLIGVGCIVVPSLYMLFEGLGVVPIIILLIGVSVVAFAGWIFLGGK
jgi:hypothetical protein